MADTCYYRCSIELRSGAVESIIYVVPPIAGTRLDSVRVIAAYATEWVPTDLPGQCIFGADAPARLYETFVPRRLFRHYAPISRNEAITLHWMLPGATPP